MQKRQQADPNLRKQQNQHNALLIVAKYMQDLVQTTRLLFLQGIPHLLEQRALLSKAGRNSKSQELPPHRTAYVQAVRNARTDTAQSKFFRNPAFYTVSNSRHSPNNSKYSNDQQMFYSSVHQFPKPSNNSLKKKTSHLSRNKYRLSYIMELWYLKIHICKPDILTLRSIVYTTIFMNCSKVNQNKANFKF